MRTQTRALGDQVSPDLRSSDDQAVLFTIISFEFNAYVITRQVVNVFEYLLAWRGQKGKMRQNLRSAKTYEEWVAAAKQLDEALGFEEWKETEDDGYYDYFLVRLYR